MEADRAPCREFQFRRPDGTPFPVELSASSYLGEEGRSRGGIVFPDISERRHREVALRKSKKPFEQLITDAPLPIAINRDGVTLFANPTYLRTFGYQEMSEVIGTPVTQRFAPKCRERLRQRAIRRQRGDTAPMASEGVGLRLDGSRFSFLLQSVRIELPDGPAILAYYTDLTELQRAEEELRKLAFHLREANAALTRLSNQDGQTSLANRRHFDEFLERHCVAPAGRGKCCRCC